MREIQQFRGELERGILAEAGNQYVSLGLAEVTAVALDPDDGTWWITARRVEADDDTIIDGIRALENYRPFVGDTTRLLMLNGGGPLAIGDVIGPRGQVDIRNESLTPQSDYVDSGWASLPSMTTAGFRKMRSGTRVRVQIHVSAFAPDDTVLAELGAHWTFTATDYAVQRHFIGQINIRSSWSGVRYISGLPAGSGNWVARMRKITGSGIVRVNSNDAASMEVTEVP